MFSSDELRNLNEQYRNLMGEAELRRSEIYPEPASDVDTTQNFNLFKAFYTQLIQTKTDNGIEHIRNCRNFTKYLFAMSVVDVNALPIILEDGLLPYDQRPEEDRKTYGILPTDDALNAKKFNFATYGKPQERGSQGNRVVLILDPSLTVFFTLQDSVVHCPNSPHGKVDWKRLREQKMHTQHLQDFFSLMLALAYDDPNHFLQDHKKNVPAFPYQSENARVELELRMKAIPTSSILGVIAESDDIKKQIIDYGWNPEDILHISGESFLSSSSRAALEFAKERDISWNFTDNNAF